MHISERKGTSIENPSIGNLDAAGRKGWEKWAENVQPQIVDIVKGGGIKKDGEVQEVVTDVWKSFPEVLRDTGRRPDTDVTEFINALTQAHVNSKRSGEIFDRNNVADQFTKRSEDILAELKPRVKAPEKKGTVIEEPLRDDILDTLPPKYSTILDLKERHGLTYKQIAEKLDMKSITSTLVRAREAYLKALEKNDTIKDEKL